jgi:hypothetical protein
MLMLRRGSTAFYRMMTERGRELLLRPAPSQAGARES